LRDYGPVLSVQRRFTRYTSPFESAFSVEGVESVRLVALKPVVSQVPMPALVAADAIFTAEALSTLQAPEH
jgi:hypothetical protein